MKHNQKWIWIGGFLLSMGAIFLGWYLQLEAPSPAVTENTPPPVKKKPPPKKPSIAFPPMPPMPPSVAKKSIPEKPKKTSEVISDETPNDDQDVPPELKARFQEVAKQYELNMRFPTYSIPLSENQWDLRNPNAFISHEQALDPDFIYAIEVKLPQFVIFHGEPIPVTFRMVSQTDKPLPLIKRVYGKVLDKQALLYEFELAQVSNAPQEASFAFQIPADRRNDRSWPDELFIQVSADVEGYSHVSQSAVIKYVPEQATLTHLGNSYVQAEHLIIPLHFWVNKTGRYRVRANLYDAATQKTVAHLNQKANLSASKDQMALKVHIATLKEKQMPGPYLLTDIWVTRVPDRPGQKTEYGQSSQEEYSVNGHDLNHYLDVPYKNKANEQRLKALKALGN